MKQPVAAQGQVLLGPVTLRAVVLERVLHYMSSRSLRDFQSAVRAARIDDKHLALEPIQARQARGQVRLFVVSEDDGRKQGMARCPDFGAHVARLTARLFS